MKLILEALPHQPHFLFFPFLHFLVPVDQSSASSHATKQKENFLFINIKKGEQKTLPESVTLYYLTTDTDGVTSGVVIFRWILSGLKI